MSDEQRPKLPRITKITVTPEGVARARRESMERAGVGVSVTPELLKHAEEQGRKLRAKRQERAVTDEGREQAACDCPGCTGGPVPQNCPPTCAGCLSGQHGRWRRQEHYRVNKRGADTASEQGREQAAEVVVQTVLDDCLDVEYGRDDTDICHIKGDTASRIVRALARAGLMATANEQGREQR